MDVREIIEERPRHGADSSSPERSPPVRRNPVAAAEPISPELALVDPELARAARALLPDVPIASRSSFRPDASSEPVDVATPLAVAPLPDIPVRRMASAEPSGVHAPARDVAPASQARVRVSSTEPRAQRARPRNRRSLAVAASLATAATLLTILGLTLSFRDSLDETLTRPPPAADPPPPPPSAVPVAPVKPGNGRVFVWAPAAGAAEYEFQLFRGPDRVYVSRSRRPRLVLPRTWRYRGNVERLRSGSYRWYVWPVPAVGAARSETPVVQATLTVS